MPCTKRSTSPAAASARSSASRTAASTPSDWSDGVVGALPVTRRSPESSAASVKVPPTSTPRITRRKLPPSRHEGLSFGRAAHGRRGLLRARRIPSDSLVLDLVGHLNDRWRHLLCDALQRARGQQPLTERTGLVCRGELQPDEHFVPIIDGSENLVPLCRLLPPCRVLVESLPLPGVVVVELEVGQ